MGSIGTPFPRGKKALLGDELLPIQSTQPPRAGSFFNGATRFGRTIPGMAEMHVPASDEHLLHILDVPKHWLLHFVGMMPVSAYSLRKAFIEAHRLSSSDHVLQRS